ncbi:retrovirus-related Pol polyprotein from transposon 297 [Trichonephila clavipes]|uniref:RNA-directed DNA polymerase n=1 Tax=Trichonephila clavipes TaxID=2585209 RepID=A0A8X6UVW5_TRICX|nr:retrovirus-related Pol polyprotein from transposon 297 [Trichonephila clavipes]
MPFGLKNALSTFQRLMDIFRRGLPILAYLVDPEKTSAILGIPPPKNVKQLQSFLQTCSWYRKFIANFSEIARPLSNLTKKKAFWEWSEEEEKAFQTLKQCLVSPPILKQADFSKPFLIRTDASNYALAAVLLQGEDKEEHPVEFASRLLNPAESNYSTTEQEALAVVWALNKFRGYIDGASITVASDHQPLRWLMKLKSPCKEQFPITKFCELHLPDARRWRKKFRLEPVNSNN